MDLLLGECERDARCNAAFPQIRDDWKKSAGAAGETAGACGIFSARQVPPLTTVEFQRGVFAEKIRTGMYRRDQAGRIPMIIHHAANGDLVPFLQQTMPLPSLISWRTECICLFGDVRGRRPVY